jgi:hypothetical protein
MIYVAFLETTKKRTTPHAIHGLFDIFDRIVRADVFTTETFIQNISALPRGHSF